MMGLDERLFYLLVGALIGFVFGYITRTIQKIDHKVDRVIGDQEHKEGGFMKLPTFQSVKVALAKLHKLPWRNIMVGLVVAMTAYAAFAAQHSVNQDEKQDEEDRRLAQSVAQVGYCNQETLGKAIIALNERTTYTKSQTQANIELQIAFQEFLRVLTFQPPKPEEVQEKAFYEYFEALNLFVELAEKTKGKQDTFPFPKIEEFRECLNKPFSEIQKEVDYVG